MPITQLAYHRNQVPPNRQAVGSCEGYPYPRDFLRDSCESATVELSCAGFPLCPSVPPVVNVFPPVIGNFSSSQSVSLTIENAYEGLLHQLADENLGAPRRAGRRDRVSHRSLCRRGSGSPDRAASRAQRIQHDERRMFGLCRVPIRTSNACHV